MMSRVLSPFGSSVKKIIAAASFAICAVNCVRPQQIRGRATSNPTRAPLADRTLVVYNSNVTASRRLSEYYQAQRGIPNINVTSYGFSNDKVIPNSEYVNFKAALRTYLNSKSVSGVTLKNRILYIVFAYRTPYWVVNAGVVWPRFAEGVGLDSFISDLWDETSYHVTGGPKDNPYTATLSSTGQVQKEKAPPDPWQSFADYRDNGDSRRPGYPNNGPGMHIYSVWRFDAPTQAQAQKQIDDAIYAQANGLHGKFYFGTCGAQYPASRCGYDPGGFFRVAADTVYSASQIAAASPKIGSSRVVVDYGSGDSIPPATPDPDGLFIYGDGYRDTFTWNRGSFGLSWRSAPLLADADGGGGPRAGIAYGLAADPQGWAIAAIDRGITVTDGAMIEPLGITFPAADVFWRSLVTGANMGDSLFRATRLIHWNNVQIGDPLYVPFP